MDSLKRCLPTDARSLLFAGAAALALYTPALAQTPAPAPVAPVGAPAPPPPAGVVSEVVVTGSYIRGAASNAALPIDVIGSNELEKRGNPTTLELIKNLPISNGVLGDTNQFDSRAQGSEGTGSINLRGLGPERTLVLLNGRRLAANPVVNTAGGAVDTNLIPSAAIARVEILKDGAAATYGSDAIAGVVNFITRRGLNGVEVAADYRQVADSDGDYTASILAGGSFGNLDVLATVGYEHRSQLRVLDRDFANPSYLQNPQGGYTAIGNPGSYIPLGAANTALGPAQRDVNCSSLDGFAGFSGATPVCYSRSTQFDNIVEEEDRAQFFGTLNYKVNEHLSAYLEGLYSYSDIPHYTTTPSQALTQLPTVDATGSAALAGRLFVPASNPGFASYVAANPGAFPAGTAGVQLVSYRPLFLGGNPLFGGTGGGQDERSYNAFRVSGGIRGDIHGVNFDLALTYMEDKAHRTTSDVLVDRLELALRGLGGPACDSDPATPGIQGTPGVGGCMYFNPFSTAVAKNSATGATNPQYNGAVANSTDVVRWFYQRASRDAQTSLFVVDGVFNGKFTTFSLPGGQAAWAVGGQYRRDSYTSHEGDLFNTAVTPCLATPDFNVTSCTPQTGPFGLIGTGRDADLSGDVYALFGELDLPLLKTVQAQVAARYEDYGGGVGSTFDPKVSIRWQTLDWLSLRGSVGTTFRGPPTTALDTNPVSTLQQIRGVYRVVDTFGDPNLQPEKALTYNLGVIAQTSHFRGTLDYWGFHFDDPIVAEPIGAIASALYPTTTTNRCSDPAYAAIRQRFTFQDLNGNGTDDDCAAGNVSRLRTNIINGSSVSTSGMDLSAEYHLDDVFKGTLTFGANYTYVFDYSIDALSVAGILVAPAFNAVGKLNYQTTAYPLPRWRGSTYAEYEHGRHTLRLTVNMVDGYTDQRTDIYAATTNNSPTGTTPVALPQGKFIDDWFTADLSYRLLLPRDLTLTASMENVLDQDPPFVRLNLSYDPFTTSGLGRTFKVGIRKKF